MLNFKKFILNESATGETLQKIHNNNEKFKVHSSVVHEDHPDYTHEHNVQAMFFGANDYLPFGDKNIKEDVLVESIEDHPTNPKRMVFRADGAGAGAGKAVGIVVPKHMWEGGSRDSVRKRTEGMQERNVKRAQVYGSDSRSPLGIGQIANIHRKTLDEHFKLPKEEQIRREREAIDRLHRAGHLDSKDTTDAGEKTDTVQNEFDDKGRSFVARSSKGVAGHALYTSGHGENEKHHILNTCPGQTTGCGGGVDANGVVDTLRGTCFAPRSEAQYVNASVRRACHEQSKHDPAMTSDWILAHTHSLRMHSDAAEEGRKYNPKTGKLSKKTSGKSTRFLFRPNVLDETDRSSRFAIKHLNDQKAAEGKSPIVANSYGKTNELHDPENGYHVTFSNTGPKTKHGTEITENKKRDSNRVRQTISSTESSGKDIKNDDGNATPAKNSYMVLNVNRGSARDAEFQSTVKHAKYWSEGRDHDKLTDKERAEGDEGHYDGNGKPTTPDKSHYGHKTITRDDGSKVRYDYQKQHILHPRIVPVVDSSGKVHNIPTDSRFKDDDFLPPKEQRFKTKNGKVAGALLATTPTTSTSEVQHHSNFTHDVSDDHIQHAKYNGGEYEIDKPEHQEAAKGKEYQAPEPTKVKAAEFVNSQTK